jgi:O-antigen/teichoic acid export membrane protein
VQKIRGNPGGGVKLTSLPKLKSVSAVASVPSGRLQFYKEALWASGWYGLAVIAQRLASFVLLPVYTRCLTPRDYGVMELLDLTLAICSMLLGASFASALCYHYFGSTSEEERRKTVSTTVLGSILLGVVAFATGVAAARPLSDLVFGTGEYAGFLRLLFATFALSLPVEAVMAWLKALNRANLYLGACCGRLGLQIGATMLLLLKYRMGLRGVIWSSLLVAAVSAVLLTIYCIVRSGARVDLAIFRRLLRYSFPLGIGGLALFVLHSGDRFVLQRYTTLAAIGLYALAYKLGMLIAVAHGIFHTYWSTQVYRLLQGERGKRLFTEVFTYLVLGLAYVVLLLIMFAGPALRELTTPPYYSATAIVPVIALAYAFRAVGDYLRCIFYTEGRPKDDMAVNWAGAAICLVAYFGLIPFWKVWGAAIATLIAFGAIALLAGWHAWRLWPYRLETGRLLRIGLCLALAMSVFYCLRGHSMGRTLGVAVAVAAAYPILILASGFGNPAELAFLRAASARVWRQLQV